MQSIRRYRFVYDEPLLAVKFWFGVSRICYRSALGALNGVGQEHTAGCRKSVSRLRPLSAL